VKELFSESWAGGVLNAVVAVPQLMEETLSVYSYIPFKDYSSCFQPSVVLLRKCGRNQQCLTAEDMFGEDKVKDLQGCPMRVSVSQLDPYATLVEDEDQGYRLEGLVDDLFTGLVKAMNFTPIFVMSQYGACELPSTVNDVSTRKVELAISFTLSQTPYNCNIARPTANIMTCYTWCMPAEYVKNSVWMFLLDEFDLQTWCLILASMIAVFLFTVAFSSVKQMPLRSVSDIVILGVLPQPIELRSEAPSVRILVISLFMFNMVLSTVYQAELHSMSVFPDTHSFKSVAELAYSTIPVSSLLKWQKFMFEVENPEPYLIHLANRIRTYNSSVLNAEYAKFRSEYNSAALIPREACVYFMSSRNHSAFSFFPDYCMSTFELNPYMLHDTSPFIDTILRINHQLYQAGFNTRALPPVAPNTAQVAPPRRLSLNHIYPFMLVLAVGWAASSLFFLCELFVNDFGKSPSIQYTRTREEERVHTPDLKYKHKKESVTRSIRRRNVQNFAEKRRYSKILI